MSTVREQNRQATENRIVDAVQALLVEEHPASLSMPAVAERAAVSLRTLYRYFPTKDALVDAASHRFDDDAQAAVGQAPGADNVREYLDTLWRAFDEDRPAVIAQHVTPAGRELRTVRWRRSAEVVRAGVADAAPDLDDQAVDDLVHLVGTMASSSSYLELCEHHGLDTERAARLASWAVGALIATARRERTIT